MKTSEMNTKAIQCPNCGDTLYFEPAQGKLLCKSCGCAFLPQDIGWRDYLSFAPENGNVFNELPKLMDFVCAACGAKFTADANLTSLRCPYCGGNIVTCAVVSGATRVGFIIPFSCTKTQAVKAYEEYYKSSFLKRILLPGSFTKKSRVEEIQGIYVPFWLYDAAAYGEASYETYDSEKRFGGYYVRHTYREDINCRVDFSLVPADASERIADDLMDSLEPFDTSELVPFSVGYLPGFMAQRYDTDPAENKKRAVLRMKETACEKLRKSINHETLGQTVREEVNVYITDAHQTLLPVWMLTTLWKDRRWTFSMNGQTGAFTGDLPISLFKTLCIVLPIFLAPLVAGVILDYPFYGIFGGALLCLYVLARIYLFMKPVLKASDAKRYAKGETDIYEQSEEYLRDDIVKRK